MPKPHDWEVEHSLWKRSEDLRLGFAKEYQNQGDGDQRLAQESKDLRTFNPVPSTTKDDMAMDRRSLRRRLGERLFLLVKSRNKEGSAGGFEPGSWHFPVVEHAEGESIRQTGERALSSSVGRSQPIFFIGNAPMGHLPSIPEGSTTFFMLAQVVGDPWSCKLKPESGYEDWAWVTKEEMPNLVQDPRLRELLSRML
ncbi:hypothetical protein CEUSTIGMA_g9656.t1 [Chlamydomonas eustigma]|uniref:Nudix hydrolase domain-containing protein n=1 Tax=Chlamydomonas eustigma TaxID=1157962 RepID=A0A250XGM7_9CHLO|nr:hypothetical protein CEUSTIGMA_g9656.t1 [Chlamydomonas eustigma]|eukprot:GAX82228.1 hypothetical protein CEUSTIGMA_g9656.t1 [Chlamydomonas eustigma]